MIDDRNGVISRFATRFVVDQASGCWLWTGRKMSEGYGMITVSGRSQLAHRISFELYRGPIAAGLVIDHLCSVRACVNPNHLDATTQRINNLRSFNVSGCNARKRRCDSGHVLPQKYVANQRRRCAPCHNARNKEYRDRLKVTRSASGETARSVIQSNGPSRWAIRRRAVSAALTMPCSVCGVVSRVAAAGTQNEGCCRACWTKRPRRRANAEVCNSQG